MENTSIRAYLHDLNNALNAIKINAYLLRRLQGDLLDKPAIDALDSAVADAERIVQRFQGQVMAEPGKQN